MFTFTHQPILELEFSVVTFATATSRGHRFRDFSVLLRVFSDWRVYALWGLSGRTLVLFLNLQEQKMCLTKRGKKSPSCFDYSFIYLQCILIKVIY